MVSVGLDCSSEAWLEQQYPYLTWALSALKQLASAGDMYRF